MMMNYFSPMLFCFFQISIKISFQRRIWRVFNLKKKSLSLGLIPIEKAETTKAFSSNLCARPLIKRARWLGRTEGEEGVVLGVVVPPFVVLVLIVVALLVHVLLFFSCVKVSKAEGSCYLFFSVFAFFKILRFFLTNEEKSCLIERERKLDWIFIFVCWSENID